MTFSTILIPYITTNEKNSINYFYIGNYVGNKDQKKIKINLEINGNYYDSDYDYNKGFYIFPLRIKDVKKGTLVIEYNGIKKEVEFEYGYKWFYYH